MAHAVFPSTWEVEIRRIEVKASQREKLVRSPSQPISCGLRLTWAKREILS
jgi:hypothetical protein